ncbi:hypothetical protein HU200_019805 [Digitaria exilis]|uniref:Protein kinase domain-containing protein n=1 Tax=Digitaria exilis TaxID=1010633 RepID=A0A835F2I1_9POAL|nr:hypothetical protein HU200_019805 [Digitaria exilis]
MKEGLRSLNLSSNRLSQPLSDLSQFLQLEVLDLSINHFTGGNLNTYLSSFRNLRSLNLSFNSFSGDVPTSMVGSLAELVLSGNQLSGSIPQGVFSYKNLTLLDLRQNYLIGSIPNKFNNISKLESLILSGNNLTGQIPLSLLHSRSLYRLRLGGNRLSGIIPSSICDGRGLTYLELNNNQLTGNIPSELGNCKNLSLLSLPSNKLQGLVPDAISSLDKLVVLNLQNNSLSGRIPNFSDLRSLSTLNLSHNSFTGQIPYGIFQLQKLSTLDLQGNNISGDIPVSISSSQSLIELNLANNVLTGTIPTMPTTLSTSLNLSHNNLSGSIPSSLGNLIELEILDLSYNGLSGEVPSSLRNLQSLTQLNVEISTVGNPGLTNGTGNNTTSTVKKKGHTVVLVIFTLAGALVGLCLVAVIVVMSLSKRIYRVEDGEGVFHIINGRVVMDNNQTSATEFTNARPDNWQITTFQALNFDHADIHHRLMEKNLIGSGGSGHVYRVTYTNRYNSHNGVVAVKQIRRVGSLDEKLEREFESEASILCNIRHNNIVRLLCCLSSAESKLLVYDYMDNGSLDAWLHGDRVPLDWPTRLIVAVGAAQGLCYMHHDCSPPIVHRDIKTSNILLDSEFRAKVADFGLARMLVQAGEPNTMSAVAGSFGHMAPEYAYTRRVNEKVDVYSFGVVLLELTTGRKANDGGELGCLAEWARHHNQSGASILDATDKSIRYAGYPSEIETVFRLGVQCTGTLPLTRPTMKDVLQILLKCSEQTLRKSRMEFSMEY